jgi:hypothetical protein
MQAHKIQHIRNKKIIIFIILIHEVRWKIMIIFISLKFNAKRELSKVK